MHSYTNLEIAIFCQHTYNEQFFIFQPASRKIQLRHNIYADRNDSNCITDRLLSRIVLSVYKQNLTNTKY